MADIGSTFKKLRVGAREKESTDLVWLRAAKA